MDTPSYPVAMLRNLSYSSILSLHSCPRKYMLRKCLPKNFAADDLIDFSDINGDAEKVASSSTTLAFGKAVGVGVQSWMMGKTDAEIAMDMFLEWDTDYDGCNDRQKKNFGLALAAVDKFKALQTLDIDIHDYELIKIPGTALPAVELGFVITFPNGHKYRGFIDAVLRNKYSGEILVLECKTTAALKISAAKYKNSEQGLSYALVLDKLFGKLASYGVLYTSYLTISQKWETFYFAKSSEQRLGWFRNTVTDINTLERYIADGYFPAYGESCESWNRPCEFLDMCHSDMSKFYISEEEAAQIVERDAKNYHIELDVLDVLDSQLED